MVLIVHLPDVASASSNIMDITLSEAPIYVVKQTCFNACSELRAGVFLWPEAGEITAVYCFAG